MSKINILRLILICCFTAIGFLLLSLEIATYVKFVPGPEGYEIEQIVHDNFLKIDMEYMYQIYFAVFFPVILLLESFIVKMPFSILHKIMFVIQSFILLSTIPVTWLVIAASGIMATAHLLNGYIILGIEIIYFLFSVILLFKKARPVWQFIFSFKE